MQNYSRILIFLVILVFSLHPLSAAWGDFDTTFGFLGASIDPVTNHYPADLEVQADGKILITGYRLVSGKRRFFLKRYLSNGQIDTSFGSNGYGVPTALINVDADYSGYKIAIQANGRIAVLGVGNGSVFIWRFYSSGAVDNTIGGGGMKKLPTGYNTTYASEFATFANLLYVGLTKNDYSSAAILKFNSNGTQDTSFGNGGELIPNSYLFFRMAVEAGSGNILVGGKRWIGGGNYGIERFLTTGQQDATFSHYDTGYEGAPGVFPSDFVRRSNGQFVLNEAWYSIAPYPPMTLGSNLVHFQSDGDYSGRTNYVPVQENQNVQSGPCPTIVAEQTDGRVIARGVHSNRLHRFSSNFSTVQSINCDAYTSLSEKTFAVLQSDNKMIAAGRYNGNIAIVRTLP